MDRVDCEKWAKNKLINPRTGRAIQEGKGVYNKIKEDCEKYLTPSERKSSSTSPQRSSSPKKTISPQRSSSPAKSKKIVNRRKRRAHILLVSGDVKKESLPKISSLRLESPKSPRRSSPKGKEELSSPRRTSPKGKEESSPSKGRQSPSKRSKSPSKEHRSPSGRSRSPKNKSPESLPKSPSSTDIRSPGNEIESPKVHAVGFTLIDGYVVNFNEPIGEGSFASIYGAQKGNVNYAAKVIQKRSDDDYDPDIPEIRIEKLIASEKNALGLDHPNIVKYYSYSEGGNAHIFFMDLYDTDFHDFFDELIQQHGELSEDLAKHYFRQMYEAILYLHTHKIAHRDIKLENFLYKRNEDRIALGDFGFALSWQGDTIPMIDTYEGSPYYAAPELFKGERHKATAPDIWALGICLFILLTGRYPFMAENNKELFNKVLYDGPFEGGFNRSNKARKLILLLLKKDGDSRIPITGVMNVNWL